MLTRATFGPPLSPNRYDTPLMPPAADTPPPERPAAPEPAPRPGKPPRIVLRGGSARWVGPLFMTLILVVGTAGRLNGQTEVPPLAVVVFVLAAIATAVSHTLRRADIRLWQQGAVAEGEITKSYRRSSGSGEDRTTSRYVHYRYEVDGVEYKRRRQSKWVAKPQPIWVIYDRDEPNKSLPTW